MQRHYRIRRAHVQPVDSLDRQTRRAGVDVQQALDRLAIELQLASFCAEAVKDSAGASRRRRLGWGRDARPALPPVP